MRRHPLSFIVAIATVGACSFPDPDYATGDDASALNDSGGVDGTASSSSGGNDGSSGSSGGGDAAKDHGGPGDSASDVTTSDSTSSSSGSSSEGGPCDMDADGFKAVSCGGNDCCDTDAKANPAQTMFFGMADNCGSFDYNCDGSATTYYNANLTCSGVGAVKCFDDCPTNQCNCGGMQCNQAYLGTDPGCGNGAPLGTCVSNMLGTACVTETMTQSQIQTCN